jgi:SsrA-binding protein
VASVAKAQAKEKGKEEREELIAENRKARFDFHILETFEAGLALLGTEVKAMREGRANLRDSYCRIENGEAYLMGSHLGQYSHGGSASHDPVRPKKLLLHIEELRKLIGKTTEKGMTIVPLRMYFKRGRAKLEIALAKGKKSYDKRETIKRREADRETRAAVKTRIR